MIRRRHLLLAVAVAALTPVVGHAQDTAAAPRAAPARKKRGDLNRITRDDLEGSIGAYVSALDIIRGLRPRWLTSGGMGRAMPANIGADLRYGATEIVYYIDGTRQPSVNEVSVLPATSVAEMRFHDQNRAVQMFGTGHELGVIEITTTAKAR
ncbi:MAG: hypothetical protein IT355_18560 [Gemmatimonadaceae bacterium]|nr:hypothetical protein [Gemmatimonadaceae bacterium]